MPRIIPLRGGCIRFHPSGSNPRWTWRFRNDTDRDIHDLFICTDLTDGIDPDITRVRVRDASGTSLADERINDETEAHVRLSTAVAKGAEFEVTLDCDSDFEDDERVEICPTDDDGATIDDAWGRGGTTVGAREMSGGCVRFRPSGRHAKWSWRFVNKTGTEIHDLQLNTNLTDGDDPDLTHVKVRMGSQTLANQSVPDESSAHVQLRPHVPDESEFEVIVSCDDWFESDERIEICPTDRYGATIDEPTVQVAIWPCQRSLLLKWWKTIRENAPPFTLWGWLRGPQLTIRGQVTGEPECSGDGDYSFDVTLCRELVEEVEGLQRGVDPDRIPGNKGRGVLHCEIEPPDQAGSPPAQGKFYELDGQLRYDLGHGWWELHPVTRWQEIPECEIWSQ